MKKSIWIIALILSACDSSSSSESVTIEGSQIPSGAILQNYASIQRLQKAVIKSENTIIGEGDFLKGLYHGTWTSYTSDGKVQSITTYLNGKKQGVELLFDNFGYVETKASYHNDLLYGEYLIYKRRNIVERRNYLNGNLTGLKQKFYTDGKTLLEESNYVDGTIHGLAKWYDQEGKLKIEYEYDMGVLKEKK